MKKLFSAADRYLRICTWRDIALLKVCVMAMGLLLGLMIPAQKKKLSAWAAALVFAGTCTPLLAKFLPLLSSEPDFDE